MIAETYLDYPKRKAGLDHGWFRHSVVGERPPLRWPGDKPLALWITVPVEFFPLDMVSQPFRPAGGMDRPYPDLWAYAARDYGLRIGIFRIMRVLDRHGLRATAAVNAAIAERVPRLIDEIRARQWEIMASGTDMGALHHGGLDRAAEQEMVRRALATLRATGAEVAGWHSPAHSQSMHTMELVAAEGVRYVADWINDDLPYKVATAAGPLVAMPLTYEWSDRKVLVEHDRTVEDYERLVLNAYERLRQEAVESGGGRVLSLSVSPWIIGYPHRIRALARLVDRIMGDGAVWPATAAEIVEAAVPQLG